MIDQLDLFTPSARRTDPSTSHEAAAIATPTAASNRWKALDALALVGALGASDFQLAALTGVQQTSIGVRRGELCKAGLVEAMCVDGKPVRRLSPSGSPAQVWVITVAGCEAHVAGAL